METVKGLAEAALLAEVEAIVETERVRLLVDEEIPALRARLATLAARPLELRRELGPERAAALLELLTGAHDALVAFEAEVAR